MCKIRYIHRINGLVNTDKIIKLENREFDIVDKPYYVRRDDDARSCVFSFHYLEVTEVSESIKDNNFNLKYGAETGRLDTLSVTYWEEDRVKLELWTNFRKMISNHEGGEIIKKLLDSFDIIQKIYFKKYEVLDDGFSDMCIEESLSKNIDN